MINFVQKYINSNKNSYRATAHASVNKNSNFSATAVASVRGIFAEFTSVKRRQLNSNFSATAVAIVTRNLRGDFKEASLTRPHLLALLLLKGIVK